MTPTIFCLHAMPKGLLLSGLSHREGCHECFLPIQTYWTVNYTYCQLLL